MTQEKKVKSIHNGLKTGSFCFSLRNAVIVQHNNDEFTDYVHLQAGILVSEGQRVRKGQLLGYSGVSGYTTYPHLHFSVFKQAGKTVIPRFRKGKRIFTLQSPEKYNSRKSFNQPLRLFL